MVALEKGCVTMRKLTCSDPNDAFRSSESSVLYLCHLPMDIDVQWGGSLLYSIRVVETKERNNISRTDRSVELLTPSPHHSNKSSNPASTQIILCRSRITIFISVLFPVPGGFLPSHPPQIFILKFYGAESVFSLIETKTSVHNTELLYTLVDTLQHFLILCIVQSHKASFYPQTRRFQYNFRFKSCPLWHVR